jgi:hypothetical protein
MQDNETLPQPVQMIHLLGTYQISQAVPVATELGIADLVADGVTSSEALATATVAVPQRLHRVLRTLARHGVFTETDHRHWTLTPLAETARSEVPGSVRNLVLTWSTEHYRAFGDLVAAVRSILRGVRRAITSDGRLLVIDTVLPADAAPHLGLMIDLPMLAILSGQERTRGELESLLRASGFSLARALPTAAHTSAVEAVAA